MFAGVLVAFAPCGAARADCFLGFIGCDDTPKPAPNVAAYSVVVDVDESSLKQSIQDVSNLYKLRSSPPENGDGLARRAEADIPGLIDALWAQGYYDASVTVAVEGRPIDINGVGLDAATAAANSAIGATVIETKIRVVAGPLYTLRTIHVADAHDAPLDPDVVVPRVLKIKPGDPARANAIRDMQARIVDALRSKSHPLAKIVHASATVVHPERVVDVDVRVDPGPLAGFGQVTVTGTRDLDPAVVRSFIYVEPGDPYSPQKVAALRKSVGQIEAIGSTRILESDHLEPDGNLPITVQVDERAKHAISLGAQYSTLDGPSVQASYTDRNLFGGGERLRLFATLGFTTDNGGNPDVTNIFDVRRLLGQVGASFIKPGLGGTPNDLLIDILGVRDVTTSYTAEYGNITTAIRHRFSDELSIQGGVEFERGRSDDPFGSVNYQLFGLTGTAKYDNTDNLLNPTRGVRVTATAEEFPTFAGSSIDLFQAKAQASTYYSVDDDSRYILAGRVALGTLQGPSIFEIPDNRRFFAGGGGSVRGYSYRSLAPLGANLYPIGGSSLLEASLEARIKITDTIGIVPFFDAGGAFASAFPTFGSDDLRYAAGLGLRYYTGFGPIRLDVATPLSRRPFDSVIAVYIGIGQAF